MSYNKWSTIVCFFVTCFNNLSPISKKNRATCQRVSVSYCLSIDQQPCVS